ncbi:CBS domain-containing protein [Mesorhizobium sp. CO1-1-11]|uniref:CBS domain-containing protein n=1 Tax=Mesorhizobium sp. CO1-1-11 TaxID=2876636 RepID=UPI0029621CCE|nr:CBS domain-containing protein [Mesorhizobium sp. CO1-1-11]
MSTPVITVDPGSSIAEAAELMLSRKISCLLVARNDGTMAGIISEGDFLRRAELGTQRVRPRWLQFLLGPGKVAQEYVRANGRRVDEVMTTDVVSASPGAPLAEIVDLMSRNRIKNVPVVEGGKAVGIITRTDLLGALVRLLPKSGAATADDEQIRKRVVAELQGQTWSGGDLIGVKVNSGIVELSGAIFDERQRQAAIVAAENVAGVRAVEDGLFCAEPFSVLLVS